jgi:hypothetical protein
MLIVAAVVVWEIAAFATMQYKAFRFVSELHRGMSAADIQQIIDRQGIEATMSRVPPGYTGSAGLAIAQAWRFGTPCDDRRGAKLFFEGGKLTYWDSWHDTICL